MDIKFIIDLAEALTNHRVLFNRFTFSIPLKEWTDLKKNAEDYLVTEQCTDYKMHLKCNAYLFIIYIQPNY